MACGPGTPPLGCLRAREHGWCSATFKRGNLEVGVVPAMDGTRVSLGTESDPARASRAASGRGSACMAGHGLHYQSTVDLEWSRPWAEPADAGRDQDRGVTDVRCNQQTNPGEHLPHRRGGLRGGTRSARTSRPSSQMEA